MRLLAGYELTGYLKVQHNLRAQAIELDEDYAPVSKKFILGEFSRYFERELRRKGLLTPRLQTNDCEDFALRAMLEARYLHHETHPGLSGIAFGMVLYQIGGLGGNRHWLNFGVNWKNVKAPAPVVLNLFFYEAFTREEAFPTQQELNTCEYLVT